MEEEDFSEKINRSRRAAPLPEQSIHGLQILPGTCMAVFNLYDQWETTQCEIGGKDLLILGTFAKKYENQLLASSFLPVCLSAWNNSTFIRMIFVKCGICNLYLNLSINYDLGENRTEVADTSRRQCRAIFIAQVSFENLQTLRGPQTMFNRKSVTIRENWFYIKRLED